MIAGQTILASYILKYLIDLYLAAEPTEAPVSQNFIIIAVAVGASPVFGI